MRAGTRARQGMLIQLKTTQGLAKPKNATTQKTAAQYYTHKMAILEKVGRPWSQKVRGLTTPWLKSNGGTKISCIG